MGFQTTKTKKPDRTDHVWKRIGVGGCKCVLCGAITEEPPDYPTPKTWTPRYYGRLTLEERALSPGPGMIVL